MPQPFILNPNSQEPSKPKGKGKSETKEPKKGAKKRGKSDDRPMITDPSLPWTVPNFSNPSITPTTPNSKPKPKAKEHFSDNVKKALSNVKDEKPVKKKESSFDPKVGDEVLVRTKKVPTGEPGVVKRLNPGGRITVSTAGNKTGYAFNPKNVIPSPRVKNENISQINLLRQLTLLS